MRAKLRLMINTFRDIITIYEQIERKFDTVILAQVKRVRKHLKPNMKLLITEVENVEDLIGTILKNAKRELKAVEEATEENMWFEKLLHEAKKVVHYD